MFCAGRCVPALVWESQKSASRQGPRVRLGGAMLDNFLNIVSLVRTSIVNLYVCAIYRRASHAGPSAPLCFARNKFYFWSIHVIMNTAGLLQS